MIIENLKLITKELIKANVPITPKEIYQSSNLKMSYRTFLRGVIELSKKRYLTAWKMGNGRAKGINWIITFIDKKLLSWEKTEQNKSQD